MEIKSLDSDLKARIRSGYCVNSVTQCITELVRNSLDAKSTHIAVRVNLVTFRIQVVDDGQGITIENLHHVGKRHYTNKCSSLNDLEKTPHKFGYKGEALASIATNARKIQIVTCSWDGKETSTLCETTFRKIINASENEHCITEEKNRPSGGTTVTIEEFMYNLPVRQKRNKNIDFNEMKASLQSLFLLHPYVTITLRDDSNKQIVFNSKCADSVEDAMLQQIDNLQRDSIKYYKISKGRTSVKIMLYTKPFESNKFQLFYLNKQQIISQRLLTFVNNLLFESNLGGTDKKQRKKAHFLYLFNIKCPRSKYDIVNNNEVDFQNWESILKIIERQLVKLLEKEHLALPQVVAPSTKRKQKEFAQQIRLSGFPGAYKASAVRKPTGDEDVIEEVVSIPAIDDIQPKSPELQMFNLKENQDFPKTNKFATPKVPAFESAVLRPLSPINMPNVNIDNDINININHDAITPLVDPSVNKYATGKDYILHKYLKHNHYDHNARKKHEHEKTRLKERLRHKYEQKARMQHQRERKIHKRKHKHDDEERRKLKRRKEHKFKLLQTKTKNNNDVFDFPPNDNMFGVVDLPPKNYDKVWDAFPSPPPANALFTNPKKDFFKITKPVTPIFDVTQSEENFLFEELDHKSFIHPFKTRKRPKNDLFHQTIQELDFPDEFELPKAKHSKPKKSSDKRQAAFFGIVASDKITLNLNKSKHKHSSRTSISLSRTTRTTRIIRLHRRRREPTAKMNKKINLKHKNPKKNVEVVEMLNKSIQCTIETKNQIEINKDKENPMLNKNKVKLLSNILVKSKPTDVQKQEQEHINENLVPNSEVEFWSSHNYVVGTLKSHYNNERPRATRPEVIQNVNVDNVLQTSLHVPSDNTETRKEDVNVNDIDLNLTMNPSVDIFPDAQETYPDPDKITCATGNSKVDVNLNFTFNTSIANIFNLSLDNVKGTEGTCPQGTEQTEWSRKVNEQGGSYYLNTRTGNTMNQIPTTIGNFDLIARPMHLPKGFSQILKEKQKITEKVSSETKREFHAAVCESNKDALSSIKWKKHYLHNIDPEEFFAQIYNKRFIIDEVSNLNLPKAKKSNAFNSVTFSKDMLHQLDILGQYDNKFIIALWRPRAFIVFFDQHAVHERIRVEQLYESYRNKESAQFIATRVKEFHLPLNKNVVDECVKYSEIFKKFALEWTTFNGNLLKINTVPSCLYNKIMRESAKRSDKMKELTKDLIFEILRFNDVIKQSHWIPTLINNLINSEACRGAYMFGDALTLEECTKLISDLSSCNLPFQCAHGRPTCVPIMELRKTYKETNKVNLKSLACRNKVW